MKRSSDHEKYSLIFVWSNSNCCCSIVFLSFISINFANFKKLLIVLRTYTKAILVVRAQKSCSDCLKYQSIHISS